MEYSQYRLPGVIASQQTQILDAWMGQQLASITRRNLISDAELRQQSQAVLQEIVALLKSGTIEIDGQAGNAIRSLLTEISTSRANKGFTATETAMFVYSLRPVLHDVLQGAWGNDAQGLSAEMKAVHILLDKLGLITSEAALRVREDTIKKQQEEMLELSTPVVRLFPGILGLPLIGTLDSARTQVVMENLLQTIVDTGSTIAIIDITGVPTVDTLVAQHLLKTVAATRLMGAECIISGIRPQIAQTIVHLGVDLQKVATKATLADALTLAMAKMGMTVQQAAQA